MYPITQGLQNELMPSMPTNKQWDDLIMVLKHAGLSYPRDWRRSPESLNLLSG
jgi:hypothetical protein